MLSDKEKVEFLFREKEALRQEIILFNKTSYTSLFSFIAIFGVFLGIYSSDSKYIKADYRQLVLFLISQFEFLIVVFNTFLLANQNIHSGYIRAIEGKINRLAKDKLSIWESDIVKNYFFKPNSGLFFSQFILFGLYFFFYLFIVLTTYYQLNQKIEVFNFSFEKTNLLFLQVFEVVASAVLVIMAGKDANRIEKVIKSKLR